MLKNPVKTLNSHCVAVSGDVLAKVPKYSTITTWKKTVAAITLTKTLFFNIPSNTSTFSISREFTSLKSCKNTKELKMSVLSMRSESSPSRPKNDFPFD
ncbi:hypothetical protein HanXRQr2_Chr11g0469121 [Helianthus annuus]|uniref:Uncharacterized protein n=1 Tax=Helianthus annuus TaxID=4232 RepID=A0A9K3MY92_HELAN|nr:hypothetical protein HanXRQr2_Chr11g0469121 [Helianthus annuus]